MDGNILNRFNSKDDFNEAVKLISDAMNNGKLVFFIGAGVSRVQGYESWNGYVQLMLQYWSDQILGDSSFKDSMKYIEAIHKIKESKISNKRKVDLLYEVLEDCIPDEFEERKTEFEERYFIKLSPIKQDNRILYSLAALDAAYITTNYDNQIEKHLDKVKKKSILITDMTDLSQKLKNDIFINTVIHLHGVPNGNKDDFISSGESYKRHYYNDNDQLSYIRTWLTDKKVTLVFIGSSMEEDEVLSLIPEHSNNIAILKTDDGEGPVGDYLRKIKSDFFKEKNKTKVLWYGDNHSELGGFIEQLKDSVLTSLSLNDKGKFLNPKVSSEELIQFINNSDINEIDNALMNVHPENVSKIFRNFKNLTFTDNKNTDTSALLFSIFTDEIDLMDIDDINKTSLYISGPNNSYTFNRANYFFKKCNIEHSKLETIYKNLSSRIDIEYTSFKNNKDVMGWKIINDTENNSRTFYQDISLYNMSLEAENKLYDLISSEKFVNKYVFLTGEQIIEGNTGLKMLYKSIKHESLQVDNDFWSDQIQDRFFKNTIFIKILMLVYKSDGLPQSTISKIIKYFDFSNDFLGDDFKKFVIDNSEKIESSKININDIDYRDAIVSVGRVDIVNDSIIDEEDLEKLPAKELLLKITDDQYEDNNFPIRDINNQHVINISGTMDFFKKQLSNHNNKQNSKIIELMTYDDRSINTNLFKKYKILYEWLLKECTYPYDKKKMFKFICNNYIDINSFDPWDAGIFEEMIRSGDEFVIDSYLEIDMGNLNNPKDNFNITEFMNSNIGAYLLLFHNILQRDYSYSKVIKDKITSLENDQIKEFMIGRHYELFDNILFDEAYCIIGFSSSHIMGTRCTEKFKKSVEIILKSKMEKNLESPILTNIFLVALQEINPFDIEISNSKILRMMDVILHYKNDFIYQKEWLQYIFESYPNEFLNELLLESTINPNTDKIISVISSIDPCLSKESKSNISPKFYRKLINSPKEISMKMSSLLYACADDNNLRNYSIQIVEYILPNIPYLNRIELINKLEPYLSYVQKNNLKSKYFHL